MLNLILSRMEGDTGTTCTEVENSWTEEATAFNSLSVTRFNSVSTLFSSLPEYDLASYSERVKPQLTLDLYYPRTRHHSILCSDLTGHVRTKSIKQILPARL